MLVEAERVWKLLNGIICVYKPPEASFKYVIQKIKSNLCRELNSMETRPIRDYLEVNMIGNEVVTNVRPSYADNVLCVGPRYQERDIVINVPTILGDLTSGVLGIYKNVYSCEVLGINHGHKISRVFKNLRFTKCYHLKGILGMTTNNFHINERVLARAKYDHVTVDHLEKVLAFFQSTAQRRTFEEHGFILTSEEAYDFATKGFYRPDKHFIPIVYNLKLINFDPPHFTLEVQCINETEVYLMNLIHNLGRSLKCYATCAGLRCIRQGYFHLEHALLKKYWTSDHIISNIKLCNQILRQDYPKKFMFSPTVDSAKSVAVE